jgi:hypothetical protein
MRRAGFHTALRGTDIGRARQASMAGAVRDRGFSNYLARRLTKCTDEATDLQITLLELVDQ